MCCLLKETGLQTKWESCHRPDKTAIVYAVNSPTIRSKYVVTQRDVLTSRLTQKRVNKSERNIVHQSDDKHGVLHQCLRRVSSYSQAVHGVDTTGGIGKYSIMYWTPELDIMTTMGRRISRCVICEGQVELARAKQGQHTEGTVAGPVNIDTTPQKRLAGRSDN